MKRKESSMVQKLLEWLESMGITGLFLVMFLEGSSLPSPGVIIVLSYGYIIAPGYLGTATLAIGMSFFYSLASLIPYFLGLKLERYLPKRLRKGIKKGIAFIGRYGIWSIAVSRPFGIGNYISYVAGIIRVPFIKYFVLTFLGIYPWSYVMIILGDYFSGNYEVFKSFFSTYNIYGYAAVAVVIVLIIGFFYKKSKQKERNLN